MLEICELIFYYNRIIAKDKFLSSLLIFIKGNDKFLYSDENEIRTLLFFISENVPNFFKIKETSIGVVFEVDTHFEISNIKNFIRSFLDSKSSSSNEIDQVDNAFLDKEEENCIS